MAKMEKIVIHADECSMALKYDYKNEKVVLGGYTTFRSLYEHILEIYFGVETLPEPVYPKQNKIKLTAPCTGDMYRAGIIKMKKHGIGMEYVRSHGMLLR